MADDGSQQRKPNLRSAVEDVKALATVLVMELESVLGTRLKLRSPAGSTVVGVGATLVVTAVVVVVLLLFGGGAKAVSDNAALIGALVALGGIFTTQMVNSALEAQRVEAARNTERARRERELAGGRHRAQDEALQAYLDQMSDMLIPNNEQPSLSDEDALKSLRVVARARTLTVLPRLDVERKVRVVQFLYESSLIANDRAVLDLSGADLSGVDLSGANLSAAKLSQTNLFSADLSGANLSGALGTSNEELERKARSLKDATMPDGQKYEDWLKSKGGGEDGKNTSLS
jgi:hypothetical protein